MFTSRLKPINPSLRVAHDTYHILVSNNNVQFIT